MLYTSSGVWLAASTRGDGWLPISSASRDTRPPSSSTLTASGSGPADAGDVGQRSVGQHRQVRPAADEDAADVVVVDDRPRVGGAGDPDHQQLRQLVAGRHAGQQRRPVTARRRHGASGGSRGGGGGHRRRWRRRRWCGGLGRRRTGSQKRRQRRQDTQSTGQGHSAMLSCANECRFAGIHALMSCHAFVLGGGGLLGAAEAGMASALLDAGVRPDVVCGTSVGAINGAALAADPTPDRREEVVGDLGRVGRRGSTRRFDASALRRSRSPQNVVARQR